MKIICCALFFGLMQLSAASAATWEKEGGCYFLTKDTRDNFAGSGAGSNKFANKYLDYEGVSFLVRGEQGWKDYGRLDLGYGNLFSIPIRHGMKVGEVHLLSGGNFGNSYKHDRLLSLFGDNYYYAAISLTFVYQDGVYKVLSVPLFWDWFHPAQMEWSKDGARVKCVGNNPVRKDCSIYHISFANPRKQEPVKDILITDSWLGDIPFSDIFALTIRSDDQIEAAPKQNKQFAAEQKTILDGWVPGCSDNWDAEPSVKDLYAKTAVVLPACGLGGDKSTRIEKKVSLSGQDNMRLEFSRHSAAFSEFDKQWSDGRLTVMADNEIIYDKVYSGEWETDSADLSEFRGKTVVISFVNHGAGTVRMSKTGSPLCDDEDAVIADIKIVKVEKSQ